MSVIPGQGQKLSLTGFKWQCTAREKQLHLLGKCFTTKSISRQLRIFNPVNCKQKLTGEMMKPQGCQFIIGLCSDPHLWPW